MMRMARENFVTTAVSNHLRGIYSFVRGDTMDRKLTSKLALAPDEAVAGVYINHADDYLVFTEFCIRHFYGQKQQIIQYRSISKVEMPDEDVPELILTLEDGQVVSLLIENETEGH